MFGFKEKFREPLSKEILKINDPDEAPAAPAVKEPLQEDAPAEEKKQSFIKQTAEKIRGFFSSIKRPFDLKIRLGFFLLSFVIMEIFVRIADSHTTFFGLGLFRDIFAGAAFGAILFLISFLIPKKGVARGIMIFVFFAMALLCMIQACSRTKFGTYFQISYMFKMAGNAVGSFMRDIIGLALGHIWLLPFTFGPAVLLTIFRKDLIPEEFTRKTKRNKRRKRAYMLRHICLCLVLTLIALILCWVGPDKEFYTYNYTATNSVPRFGILNTVRLEVEYGIFGTPKQKINLDSLKSTAQTTEEGETTENGETLQEETTAAVIRNYPKNVMDIDFDTLIANDTSEIYELMDTYFSNQEPTSQNEYTGLFKGKNLIFLTAEAFSPLCVDKERTPALWRLSHTGFVFENYYQPDFDQSTTGGEFSNMSGLIPMWVNNMPAFLASEYNYMPFALGTIFGDMGYNVTAWHNGIFDYYYRDETHPNMGYYDYKGDGNGLEVTDVWPPSDLEMMENTIGDQIKGYVEDGVPFHSYYMTISGHGGYDFLENHMAVKNRDAIGDGTGYEMVDAYIAANMELEYAMEYLLEELEKAGILDDTVIVMGADHYPYYLTENQDEDYYALAAGIDDEEIHTERHHNTLILWSGCIEDDTKIIDTPCYSCDIVPTLMNLFGIEYDSRLFSGRDIFAPDVEPGKVASNMHVACFNDGCWVTAAGRYDVYRDTFYPAAGFVPDDEEAYVDAMNELVGMRCTFAKYIVEYDYYAHVFQ
ncbi:MAG: hypothetical protein E7233_12515 [Lachnospiraceae bacterium]|nr:hypothetical protein [Lachnospiraceae bacterium]